MRQRITNTLLAASILMHPSIVHARYYSEWQEETASLEFIILYFIFWGFPTYLIGNWAGAKWGFKGTPCGKVIDPFMSATDKAERLYGRLAKRLLGKFDRPFEDAEPDAYSLASYFRDIATLFWVVFYAAWRVLLWLVFAPLICSLVGFWFGYAVLYFLLLGGLDFGAEKGRAEWERRND